MAVRRTFLSAGVTMLAALTIAAPLAHAGAVKPQIVDTVGDANGINSQG